MTVAGARHVLIQNMGVLRRNIRAEGPRSRVFPPGRKPMRLRSTERRAAAWVLPNANAPVSVRIFLRGN